MPNITGAAPLAGLRVVDWTTGTAGTRLGGLFADYGADVIWVERPGGDPFREHLAPEYAVFNRGKRSIEIDLKTAPGKASLLELLDTADVLLHSWRPGVAESLGVGYSDVHLRCPRLIYTQITGFGPGRYKDVPGYETIIHALVGTMADQFGHRDGPIFEALPFASVGAAYLAALGTLAAIYRRKSDGWGRSVETSLYDGALAYMMLWGTNDNKPPPSAKRDVGRRRSIVRSFQCSDDRYIGVHTGAVGAFNRFLKATGLDDRIKPSLSGLDMTTLATAEEARILAEEVPDLFLQRPAEEWVERLLAADVCVMPLLQPGEVFDEPQTLFNNMVVEVTDPRLGAVQEIGPAVRWHGSAPEVRRAPRPGEHTREVLAELPSMAKRATLRPEGEPDTMPLLAGLHVLDLGAYYAGPFSSRLLADLGASVIKLEPLAGDPLRGRYQVFNSAQAGKRALSVDLKSTEGKEIGRRLLQWADVVHHNMRPGSAERLGCGYEDARSLNPDIIYLHAPGWGSAGPFAQRQSFAPLLSGYVGIGFEVAGVFNPPLFPVGNEDSGNGLLGAVAILMGLLLREERPEAQFIENPQLNAALTHVAHHVRNLQGELLSKKALDPLQLGWSSLDRLYETQDGWLCLVATAPGCFPLLARLLELPLEDDKRFDTPEAREQHDYELGMLLAETFASAPTDEWLKRLQSAGIPAVAPVVESNNEAFMHDPENVDSRRVAVIHHPTLGYVREFDLFMRISDSALPEHRLAPELGEHTDVILSEHGYDETTIGALRRARVIL